MLDHKVLLEVVRVTPLVSIDLILVRDVGAGPEVLLGRRNNRPALGSWFVPGGRILKDETRVAAMARIGRRELGIDTTQLAWRFQGVYEHFYDDCFAGDIGVSTHYVVLAWRADVGADFVLGACDDQHEELLWRPVRDAVRDDTVHANTRAYF